MDLAALTARYGAPPPVVTDMFGVVRKYVRCAPSGEDIVVYTCAECPAVGLSSDAIASHARCAHHPPSGLLRCEREGCTVASLTKAGLRAHLERPHDLLNGRPITGSAVARQLRTIVWRDTAACAAWLGVDVDHLSPAAPPRLEIDVRRLLYPNGHVYAIGCDKCPAVGLSPQAIAQHQRRAHAECALPACTHALCAHVPSARVAPTVARQSMRRHMQTTHRLIHLLEHPSAPIITHIERRTLLNERHNVVYPSMDAWRAAFDLGSSEGERRADEPTLE